MRSARSARIQTHQRSRPQRQQHECQREGNGLYQLPQKQVELAPCSYKIIADVELTDKASGVIFAHGSRFGGHALFIEDRKVYYVYNFLGIRPEQKFMSKELAPGKYALGMEFNVRRPANTASRLARRGCTSTTRSPPKVRCACRSAFTLSGDGLCIGFDSGDNVSQEYRNPGRFTGGRILGVAIDVSSEKYLDLEQEAVAALARD